MWLHLETVEQYRLTEISKISSMLRSAHLILSPADVIVIGAYAPSEPPLQLFKSLQLPESECMHVETLEYTFNMNRSEYPGGHAYHIPATKAALDSLAAAADAAPANYEFCEHLAGYSSDHPIFIFHDAPIDPLFLSSKIPEATANKFAAAMDAKIEFINFEEEYG